MSTTDKKSAAKKPAVKKSASKKTTTRKTASKKTAAKKKVAKKTVTKKIVAKKIPAREPSIDHDEVSRISAKNLETIAMDIDRQMKMLAEIDTRVLIAKDQLADFQERIQSRISAFQERNAKKHKGSHKDLMTSIRETRDEASKLIKDSKAIHDTYESAVAKKAEIALVKKLHEVEVKMLKRAGEIKKNIKK
jgi:hypothetical protein